MCFKLIYAIVIISYNFIGLASYPANEYEGIVCGEGITKGSCKLVVECPVAQEALMKRKLHGLERCGFDGFIEVVCCPDATPDARAPVTTRKSEMACKEFTNEVSPDPTIYIIGGANASLGEFPHMSPIHTLQTCRKTKRPETLSVSSITRRRKAALGYKSEETNGIKWACGGTLISNRFVLTAAHCIIKLDRIPPTTIRLGIIDLTGSDDAEPQDYGVFNITIHPEYNRSLKINDLALIKLDKDVANTKYVHPACLYQKNANPDGLIITGWGYTTAGGDPSTILQKATIRSVDGSECSSIYQSRLARGIIPSQICAVSDDGTKDTCQGDSGGPLQIQTQEATSIYRIVGVTSYGMACGGKTPGIYTRISSYLEWIEKIVWPPKI